MWFILCRSDCQRVIDALVLEETLYWVSHPIERIHTIKGIDAWDGQLWSSAILFAIHRKWQAFREWLNVMKETHVSEQIMELIKRESFGCFKSILQSHHESSTERRDCGGTVGERQESTGGNAFA